MALYNSSPSKNTGRLTHHPPATAAIDPSAKPVSKAIRSELEPYAFISIRL